MSSLKQHKNISVDLNMSYIMYRRIKKEALMKSPFFCLSLSILKSFFKKKIHLEEKGYKMS